MISKRKIMYIFHCVFVLLIICTILSRSIERQMTIQGVTVRATGAASNQLPLDTIMYDDSGMHLFAAQEGSGWEDGIRVYEMNSNSYRIEKDHVELFDGYDDTYVHYASKSIHTGDRIDLVGTQSEGEDDYLIVFPEEMVPYSVPEHVNIVEQNDNAWLISFVGEQPFMEEQAKSELQLDQNARIYSLTEIRKFLKNISLLAGLLIVLVWVVILEIKILKLILHKANKSSLVIAGIYAFILISLLGCLTYFIHLPSSLLPPENAIDFGYYRSEFCDILGDLHDFNNDVVINMFQYAKRQFLFAGGLFLGGTILSVSLWRNTCSAFRIRGLRFIKH